MINKLVHMCSIVLVVLVLLSSSVSVNIMLVNNTDVLVEIEVNGKIIELNAHEHKIISTVIGGQRKLFIRGSLGNVSNISWNISCKVYGQNYKLEMSMNKEYNVFIAILVPLSSNISVNIVYWKIVEYTIGSGLKLFVRMHGLRQVNITKSVLYSLNDSRYLNLLSITSLKYEDNGVLINVNVDRGRFPFIDVKRGILEIQLNNNDTCLLLVSLPRVRGNNTTITNSELNSEYPYLRISTTTITSSYVGSFTATSNTIKHGEYTIIVHAERNAGLSLPELLLLILFALMFSIYMFLEYRLRKSS